jgi:hypothetical protein
MRPAAFLLCLAALPLWSCRASPAAALPPFDAVADVKLLMQSVVDPAADVIWGSVKTVISEHGTQDYAPATPDEWEAVRNSAVTLAESGNLLMIGTRPRDDGAWMELARGLSEVSRRAIAAANAKDKDRLFDAGGDIYVACVNCHERYAVSVPAEP